MAELCALAFDRAVRKQMSDGASLIRPTENFCYIRPGKARSLPGTVLLTAFCRHHRFQIRQMALPFLHPLFRADHFTFLLPL